MQEPNHWEVWLFRRINGEIEQKIHLTINNANGKIINLVSMKMSDSFWKKFLKYWREITIIALSTFLAGKLTGLFDHIFR
jgi:hypothetical protein